MNFFRLTGLFAALFFLTANCFGGAWTVPQGHLWIKASFYHQSTNSRFCSAQDALSLAFQGVGCIRSGHSAPFDPFIGGESSVSAVYLDAVYGLTDWFSLGIQAPFYSLQFTNMANPARPRNNGFGDFRFFGKFRFLEKPIIGSLTFGAKSPTGSFDLDAEVVNVSEGQWDYTILGEFSKSLWPVPGYFSFGLGYNLRTDNPNFEHTFGNEFIANLEAGFNITRRFLLKGSLEWLRGQRPRLHATGDRLLWRRELLTATPAIIFSAYHNINLEAGVRLPLEGQDFPDGPQYVGAISDVFSIF